VIVTGERVVTAAGGFNPTWQRHVSAYEAADRLLGPGRVLDIGAGVGHSFHRLAPRQTVGVDIDAEALAGQPRPTVVADMRALPLPDAGFSSVLAVHAIEHVPDPGRALSEMARVVEPGGPVMLVTPNRLTFGRPDEVIDPYHFIEYDPEQLRALCDAHFASVELLGLFGSGRYLKLVERERERLARALALDPLRVRRLVPRRARQWLYDAGITLARRGQDQGVAAITERDFRIAGEPLGEALDLIAICRRSVHR
jgi:SAM-dependent methyltransferase